jgi:hydroxypyruvate isomerase
VKSRVAHIQVGGVPDRHEPSGGDFDYPAFFRLLDRQNYKGWVSGEYHPAARTNENLSWIS